MMYWIKKVAMPMQQMIRENPITSLTE